MDDENDEPVSKKTKSDPKKCANCSKYTSKIAGVSHEITSSAEAEKFYGISFIVGDIICGRCRKFLRRRKCKNEKNIPPTQENVDLDDDQNVPPVLNICKMYSDKRHISSHDAGTSTGTSLSVTPSSCKPDEKVSDTKDKPKSPEADKDQQRCERCGKLIKYVSGPTKVIVDLEEAKVVYDASGLYLQVGDIICFKCRSSLRKAKSEKDKSEAQENETVEDIEQIMSQVSFEEESSQKKSTPLSNVDATVSSQSKTDSQNAYTSSIVESRGSDFTYESDSEPDNIETIELPFPRTVISHAYCFVCGPTLTRNLKNVPLKARLYVFIKARIFIPRRNRCCKEHLIGDRFYEDVLDKITIFSHETSIEEVEVKQFLDTLADKADAQLHDKMGQDLSEEQIKALTGYSRNNLEELTTMMKNMRNSVNRNLAQATYIFLMKLKTGNSNSFIAAVLGIDEGIVRSSVNAVLKSFREEILPKHFGIKAHNRDFFISQSSEAAKKLHNLENRLAVICDGSYLRHQKSSNNAYQRKSYSGQKKLPLCKPFTVCTTNGFVIECAGPFFANMNDAEILRQMMNKPDEFSSILAPGDIFILDRGFRDVVSFLEDKGYVVLMPALKGKRNQLSVEESNASRLITKLRWVVEAVHGVIGQKAKLLHNQFNNRSLEHAGTYSRIANLLHNLFGKRLNSDDGQLDIIIERMKAIKDMKNTLAEEVETENWNRKSVPFSKLSSRDLLDFPEMTLNELKIFFTGSYQLSQSISYLAEMLQDNDTLELNYNKANPTILRFEVRSRHINAKTYKCYIHYEKNTTGINGIKRYCCNCANGNRTVGCCSHVAAIIYYLSHARYLSKIIRPANHLMKLFDYNSAIPVIEEDSDED